jgi:NOL1/NOP2/fmu family ribosome biogenesis protein
VSTRWDSSWPELAEERDRFFLLDYIDKRFGIHKGIFDDYLFLKKKGNYWLLKRSPLVHRVTSLKVGIVGMKAFQEVGSFIKPTTRMIQFFGHWAERAVLNVDKEFLKRLLNGEFIQTDMEIENGYVILSLEFKVLGLGLLINGEVRSQLPQKDVKFLTI